MRSICRLIGLHNFHYLIANAMSYQEILHPWAIARPLPNNIQSVIVGRFRRRVDAEEHLRFLRRRIPTVKFFIVFDCQTNLL
ncbi:hypothetical protein [Pseudanabaena sp. 'Roaring Creek']|uniref:hypothetical protein n=1 Tax=Pseudanabaena sp. 'Roaring Creek' TaxID=1681830 RepID=UPI000AA7C108|nr:hypothetical protein [Pseudanabaena sp. 'Roaring Creek']